MKLISSENSDNLPLKLILILFAFSSCQTAPPLKPGPDKTTATKITSLKFTRSNSEPPQDDSSILAQSGIPSEQIGYLLTDAETGRVLTQHNPTTPFIPSSVSKLATSVAALKILGPHYRFKTELLYSGKIKNKILFGDLYLKGGGDPFLTASDLMNLAVALKQKGIHQIRGKFYYDESFLPSQTEIDGNHDAHASYNTGVSALSTEFNQASVLWRPTTDPSVREVTILPRISNIGIELAAPETETSESLSFDKSETSQPDEPLERWLLHPEVPKEGFKKIPVKNAAYFTAAFFKSIAEMNQIQLADPTAGKTPAHALPLVVHPSLPLYELVGKAQEYSNNLMNELIQLNAAKKLNPTAKDLKSLSQSIQKWYVKNLKKTNWKGFALENGSGLGSNNRISPAQLNAILKYAGQTEEFQANFPALLPIAAWKGTLSGRMQYTDAALRVWAKTGTQSYATSLAGYLYSRSGKKYIFSILATDFPNRLKIDQWPKAVPDALRKASSKWTQQIRTLQENLVNSWIQRY